MFNVGDEVFLDGSGDKIFTVLVSGSKFTEVRDDDFKIIIENKIIKLVPRIRLTGMKECLNWMIEHPMKVIENDIGYDARYNNNKFCFEYFRSDYIHGVANKWWITNSFLKFEDETWSPKSGC